MLIKNIEQRIKINKVVSISAIVFAVFIVIAGFFFAYRIIEDSRKSIYILDNGVPVLAKVVSQDLYVKFFFKKIFTGYCI